MTRLLAVAALAAAVSSGPAPAAELPAPTRGEIERLLTSLGSSGCEFYRNGSWHDARTAEKHLRMKLESLAAHGQVRSAEDFIAGAATKSSMSGESYQVRCPGQAQQQSASWLGERLRETRKAAGPTRS